MVLDLYVCSDKYKNVVSADIIVAFENLQKEIIGMWHLNVCKDETISSHLFIS